ncbi:MAG: MoaD/ThiS family protein [Desulfobacterales bacterium]|nr:MAG: MoaD/ThiS family protein [Desulfobacterales bacterium]
MKVRVKLFGTLPQRYPDYNPEHGLEVEIPHGAKVKDLLAYLEISASDSGIVAVDNLVVKADEKLKDGLCVRIFQRAFGG